MSINPLVSIFIPAYNAEIFVRHAIDSVLSQTYSNFELIIIDDASTDDTGTIIDSYRDCPQVRIYHNSTNLGVARNWNLGVTLCRGDFIVRLDADDFYRADFLEKILDVFQQYPETEMVFTGVNLIYGDGSTTAVLPYQDSWVSPGTDFLPDLLRICHVRSPAACVKRTCYERLGGVIDEMRVHEDWEFWVRVTANCQIGYISEPLTNVRVLNFNGCTNQAIIHARSPVACKIWLEHLANQSVPYQLNEQQLAWLKRGMYDQLMAFAVMAMESGLTGSVEKHLAFAQKLLPPGTNSSMRARLYARAAEVYFMHGDNHLKGWRFLLKSLRSGLLIMDQNRTLKLWARAFFGKNIFEFVRTHTVVRRKFPYVRGHHV